MAAPSIPSHLPSPAALSSSPHLTLAARGMPQRPLLLPHHSPDSSEDSASPLTPPVSDCPSSSNPSPNIVPLDLGLRSHPDHDPLLSGPDPAGKRTAQAPAHDRALAHPAHPEILLSMDPPPQQRLPHAQPGAGNGKGGCWTCRIRRKKCDEQRVGDSCQTCIRLSIDCLGWGPKRPAWMRDKQAVEAYKAGIKETLIKAGKVRGQPRLSHAHAPRSATQASGPSAGHGPPGHSFPHAASRSMSGPAAYGGLGSIGPVGSMGSMGSLGSPMPMSNAMGSSMSYDFSTHPHMPHQQQHSARYGPYPSPHTLGSYSPHSTQHASYTPHASAVMGAEFDYMNFPVASGSGGQQQDHMHRRASLATPPSHMLQMQTQMFENRHVQTHHQQHQHHLGMQHQPFQHPFEGETESSSSSIAGGGSPHTTSPYIAAPSALGRSVPSQGQQHASLLDFSSDAFGNMGSMSSMGSSMSSMSSGIGGLGVHGIDMSNSTIAGAQTVTSSPLMLSGDESLLFPGPYTTGSPHHQHHQHQPPTRPPSGSASSTTVSSTSSSAQGAGLSDALTDPSLVDPHVRYYFDSVMPMQYVFAADKAQGILQNLFTLDPFGPLVNASCALAAKHNKAIRVARLLDPPDSDPLQSTAQQFFDRAHWQLTDALTRRPSMYAAVDALASLHLVAYFLMQGGSGAWQPHLDAARDWLAQTPMCTPGNEGPQRALATMDETEQLVARLTIWYDVFAGISLYQAPRFLTMYRRLLGGTVSRESGEQGADMARLLGCPDDVLLILAETAALAQWKSFERQQGTLSNRELLKRGSVIENRLLVSTIAETTSGGAASAFFPGSATVETHKPHVDTAGASGSTAAVSSGHSPNLLPLTVPTTAPSPPLSVYTNKNNNSPVDVRSDDARQRVAQVFLHTASLYLASIINEPSPGISEISSSVNAVMNALRNLPESITDRTLVLPLVIVGSLAELPEHYQFILARLGARDEAIGNVQGARLLIERVRAIRNAHGGSVDWRDVMREELHADILLV